MVLDPLRGAAWTYNQTWHSKGKQKFCHGYKIQEKFKRLHR